MSQNSELLWSTGKAMFWRWLLGLIGVTGILIIFFIIFACCLVMILSGGFQGGINTYVGSPQALPASYLATVGNGYPVNVVTLAQMELESQGKANATNYNLSDGSSSDTEPIGKPGISILSADAGLMQINSGSGWPKTPKWDQVFGVGGDPWDAKKNIAEGEKELRDDSSKSNGFLEGALSAYNTGSVDSSKGKDYANKVLANINAYEGAEADCWATGNYAGQANSFLWWSWGPNQWVQPYNNAPTWIMVAGSFPIPNGNSVKIPWKPATDDTPEQDISVMPLSFPTSVTINGKNASLNPTGVSIIPGQEVYAMQVTQPGTYTAEVTWTWYTYEGKPPVPVKHTKTITAPSIYILPPGSSAISTGGGNGGGNGVVVPIGSVTPLIQYAMNFLGTPYVWGGTTPAGFDCSGFVQYVFSHNGVNLPRTSQEQFNVGTPVDESQLQPGDLVFFDSGGPGATHVGIYVGNNMMIDAESQGVVFDDITNSYWGPKFVGARRVVQTSSN